MRAELIERGYDAVGFVQLSDALSAMRRAGSARPEVIIFDLRGQQFTSAELYALAHCGIPIIIIAGIQELSDPRVNQFKWAEVLKRPVTVGEIADAVERIAS